MKETKAVTKREALKKINSIDTRIKRSERELKQLELQWKNKNDSLASLKKDFETALNVLQNASDKPILVSNKESSHE